MVTFAQLRQSTPEPLIEFADLARKLARELDQFGADTTGHRRSLSASWEGTDASAAVQSLTRHATDYHETASAYGRVDTIITTFANQVNQAKQTLESAISMAPSIPGSIDANGTVHINVAALGPSPSPAAVAMAQARAQQVHGYLSQAIMQASQADQQAQAALVQVAGLTPVRQASPGTALQVPERGTDPKAVNDWWNGLSGAEQQGLINSHSKQIGSLDGVPITARDQANRLAVDKEIGDLDPRIDEMKARRDELARQEVYNRGPSHELAQANRELRGLNERMENLEMIREQANRTDLHGSTEKLHLIHYDSADDGKVVISAGNPDTANNIVTYVPGMGTEVGNIGKDVDRALWMQADATAADPSQRTAAVTWLGYDAPNQVFAAMREKYFEEGAADLTNFEQGLRATHQGELSNNTLLGHSYGSSTVGHVASQANLGIDNLVLVASPGGSVDNVGQYLGMENGIVWATRAEGDIIEWATQTHGNDPLDTDFGARVFPSDNATESWFGGVENHSGYWIEGNQAREHFANIVTGHHDRVPIAPHDD
ncbi:alpha/beta hydrolase [Stackebrandtia soli]|uniref:alpha/beta hydrolase n=1 Tax=Stackebrandtia soli TaxID=1892856 RepID=UPI0039E7E491